MGYACPVCGTPQADGEHLANHLAFTAMLHGDGHEAWLDERVPDWADRDPDALATDVVEGAEETDHETTFDDTTRGRPDVGVGHGPEAGDRRDGGHGHGQSPGERGNRHGSDPAPDLDPETRRIVEEARELTRQRRSGDRPAERADEDREE